VLPVYVEPPPPKQKAAPGAKAELKK